MAVELSRKGFTPYAAKKGEEYMNAAQRKHFRKILESYNQGDQHGFAATGWSEWLREGAFKVFIEITDDEPSSSLPDGTPATADNFERALFALQPAHFGTPGKRNYLWHSIIGLQAKSDGSAWTPTDPITSDECPTGVNPGTEYQKLSVATGGLRYPVCDTQSYDAVFNEVAQGIIEQSRIGCELAFPETPEGQDVDVNAMILEWTATPQTPTEQVTMVDIAACNARGFYVEASTIKLCPALCTEVAASTEGELSILAACRSGEECVPMSFETNCNDGVDNDCDGFVDRQDIECLQ
mgnify:FL=1